MNNDTCSRDERAVQLRARPNARKNTAGGSKRVDFCASTHQSQVHDHESGDPPLTPDFQGPNDCLQLMPAKKKIAVKGA